MLDELASCLREPALANIGHLLELVAALKRSVLPAVLGDGKPATTKLLAAAGVTATATPPLGPPATKAVS